MKLKDYKKRFTYNVILKLIRLAYYKGVNDAKAGKINQPGFTQWAKELIKTKSR